MVVAILAGCDRPAPTPATQHLTIAAAADLRGALQELSAAFEKSHPLTKIDPTFGSSGTFYSQLTAKAPFDLFLSADSAYPAKLVEQGLAKPDAVFKYAVGHIVVWTRKGSGIDVSKGLAALTSDGVRKIAIANPRHAPYGRAAEAALRSAGLYDTVAPKLVLGENIAEAAQFAQAGSADVGIIALSLATGMDGDYAEVPPDLYPKLEQSGVILPWATNAKLAADFREFLTSPDARAVLKRRGFAEP
jgi:molybdate transport system substrate-binding protein